MSETLKNEKAVVVFSGGQDSTTCLFYAKEHFKEVELVTFQYGQRHDLEIKVAEDIAKEQGLKHHILDMSLLSQLSPNALTDHTMQIENDENDIPNTFVPARNLLFLSFAGALAYQIGAKHIITGVCETDFSGYPDCRDSFIKSMNLSLNLSMDKDFVIHTPLMWLNKKETWALSDQLGALDYVREKTLTCYNGVMSDGCGECPACKLRKQGLDQYLETKGSL
ncbi:MULTISPECIES: 7-cyano-7-deazaguanine synthase QueC [Mammaliicoccus]|jgi:7-cyano-7-deazaguanine synthase|uniref:7-cyano-7-deazaguanine synthase n=1 Tax=Mammaliicoccus sciuri TaxID=1296 RepID=A0AAW5LH15_MAMSC|nr:MULTISPECIES: 7-cyano-7-deazaguanine synthase QueC [Mammaliicoccus]KTT83668.1 7-cyano-7-deazaguanine synthase [Mammaliicoccus sciuri]MBA1395677.1 7-cyano-7-deazaguanine synthase QueC [Mammaliicoccus sciuri]MBF0720696.1 7-cyano-7-deazaguanine synthase QueC [Mammaliicoccus sciuri]MBG9205800.1 7-cyano-7-deazaguanine synthase QueC [Mammaliicoccus sciuri]MBG9209338.1 7-cyano-7-deazaguanine synthase QueC [Mammaliicoccus sciuri]